MPHRIVIVGAGLAGSLLAVYLGRQGHRVTLYERRGDPRAAGYVSGRSINLAISERGLDALRRMGLEQSILESAVRMPGRMIHSPTGELTYQAYSRDPKRAINSISRSGLNLKLLEAAAKTPGVELVFDHRCVGVDVNAPAVEFVDERTQRPIRVEADFIIAADGAYSAVRSVLQKNDRFEYSQSFLSHGYKELTIPAGPGGAFAMERNALHIWPRGGSMMIALPNQDGSYTCTCFWPWEGPDSFAGLKTAFEIRERFQREYPDALALMPTLVEDFLNNPVGSMVTIKCRPWTVGGRVVLLGDAAHAIVPFYGQGANAAFEDVVALAACIAGLAPDWAKVCREYEQQRKRNADAIADLARDNFIEMRDKTASRLFRAKKKFEHLLHGWFPQWYVPLYDMVSFTTVPYAEARDRAARQWQVIMATVIIATTVATLMLVAVVS